MGKAARKRKAAAARQARPVGHVVPARRLTVAASADPPTGGGISLDALEALTDRFREMANAGASAPLTPIPTPPMIKGGRELYRAAKPTFAADAKLAEDWDNNALNAWIDNAPLAQGIGFLGYPYLAELTQRPEYRRISEIIAEELTREWVTLTYSGDDDRAERLAELEKATERFKLKEHFQRMCELDGVFGRGQLFIDVGNREDREELKAPLAVDKRKIGKGELKGFRAVEPMWSYPLAYNSDNPLAPDFFRPRSWSVQGKEVHASRLLTFIGRPMPDILKPAYAFGGLSLSQMAIPYVQNWLRTRQSVSDLVHSFSVLILATDMGDNLNVDAMAKLIKRALMATQFRDNRGLQLIDKNTEDLKNIAVPLGSLDKLQAQAQEQMASVVGIPLVKLLGITPSGLNATAEPEIRVFYDHIAAVQSKFLGDHLKTCLDLIQLDTFGDIDPDIGFEWVPLWQLDQAAQAAVNKTKVDSGIEMINAGVISPEEERERIARDDQSGYAGIDLSGPPPDPPQMGLMDHEASLLPDPAKTAEPAKVERASDAAFAEADHPRDDGGKFTAGGGSGGGSAGAAPTGSGWTSPYNASHVAELPRAAKQPASSWEELSAKGAEGHHEFSAALHQVAAKLGLRTDVQKPEDLTAEHIANPHGYLFVAPNKSEARARAKVDSEYEGDWSQLRDMVRASIAVSSVEDLHKAVAAVEAAGLPLAQKPKDKFAGPTEEGYRDLNTVVKLPNGMVAELQYHLKPIIAAKEEAHAHYAEQQHLSRKNGSAEPHEKWDPAEVSEFHDLRQKQRGIYGPAWERAIGT